MAGGWDVVSKTPVGQQTDPQSTAGVGASSAPVPRTIAAPIMGRKNPMMGSPSIRVLASQPPKPQNIETWRAPTDQERETYPGAIQISNRGEAKYPPQGSSAPGRGKISVQDAQYINKMKEEASKAYNMSSMLDEFINLNKSVETGGLMALPFAPEAVSPFNSQVSRMKAITDQITPAMRNGLPGAASDRDVAMFRSATVGLDKPYAANKAVADATKAFAARQNDYIAFLEAYAKKNGNLLGANEMWTGYLVNNPLFTDEKDQHGMVKLNKIIPWRQALPELKPEGGSAAPQQKKRMKFNPTTGQLEDVN